MGYAVGAWGKNLWGEAPLTTKSLSANKVYHEWRSRCARSATQSAEPDISERISGIRHCEQTYWFSMGARQSHLTAAGCASSSKCVTNKSNRSSAMPEKNHPRYNRSPSPCIPKSQSFAYGPLRLDKVSLRTWGKCVRTCARHRTHRQRNPNSRNHPERCGCNHTVRIDGRIECLPIPFPQT